MHIHMLILFQIQFFIASVEKYDLFSCHDLVFCNHVKLTYIGAFFSVES